MKDQKVSTILGIIILVIIAAIITGLVLTCFKKYPDKDYAEQVIVEHGGVDDKEKIFESEVGEKKFTPSPLVTGWQQYINKSRDYAISMPADFEVQDEMPNHIDISSSDYDGTDGRGVRIQIQTQKAPNEFETVSDYKNHVVNIQRESTVAQGDSVIDAVHYVNNGPNESFMTYFIFDEERDIFYSILAIEPGYSNNVELVEQLVETFRVF